MAPHAELQAALQIGSSRFGAPADAIFFSCDFLFFSFAFFVLFLWLDFRSFSALPFLLFPLYRMWRRSASSFFFPIFVIIHKKSSAHFSIGGGVFFFTEFI